MLGNTGSFQDVLLSALTSHTITLHYMTETLQHCNTNSVTKQTTKNKNKQPLTAYYRNQANLIHTLAPLLPSILILFSFHILNSKVVSSAHGFRQTFCMHFPLVIFLNRKLTQSFNSVQTKIKHYLHHTRGSRNFSTHGTVFLATRNSSTLSAEVDIEGGKEAEGV